MMKRFATDALIKAILQGNPTGVRVALTLNPGIVNEIYETHSGKFLPLYAAAQANSSEIVTLLLRNGADPNGLSYIEAEVDGAQYRKDLVEREVDPNIRMISVAMLTALYIASENGYSEVVRMLVEAGADPDMGTATPLSVACQENRLETAQLLLALGAKVDLSLRNDGATPLFMASQGGQESVVRLLLSNGADVGRRLTKENQSAALHVASQFGHVGVVELLVKNGAYLNATNKRGSTALMTACCWGRYEVAAFLLKAGANPDLPCHNGFTALKIATLNGYTEIVQLLASSGASADVKFPLPISVRRREVAIADFNDCLDRAEPWPTIREILVEIMPEVVAGSVNVSPGQMSFYRIRKNHGVDAFHQVADLFYPPAQSCKSYGRCNRPHAPLLYASTNPIAPIFEVGEMHIGEVFTMVSYVIRDGMSLTVAPIGIEMLAEIADIPVTEERKRALVRTNEFLNGLFTLTRTDEKYYKLTNEIIDTYFDFPGNSGFLYPSIRRTDSPVAYENLAIKPEEVDSKLGVAAVNVFRVTKTDGQGQLVEAECILTFSEVADGRVNYAPPKEHMVLSPIRYMDSIMTVTLQCQEKVLYLDLLSSGVTANRLGGSDRNPNYVEVVCPECGYRYFQHSSSELVRVFRLLDVLDVPYIGPGHECLKCGRRSSWDRWKQSSEAVE